MTPSETQAFNSGVEAAARVVHSWVPSLRNLFGSGPPMSKGLRNMCVEIEHLTLPIPTFAAPGLVEIIEDCEQSARVLDQTASHPLFAERFRAAAVALTAAQAEVAAFGDVRNALGREIQTLRGDAATARAAAWAEAREAAYNAAEAWVITADNDVDKAYNNGVQASMAAIRALQPPVAVGVGVEDE